jgi:mono/diheme cytochrome c family protein
MIRIAVAAALLPVASWAQSQIERGETLFFEGSKGCGTCHAVKGRGTAIGPDLRTISRVSVPAIVMGVRSSQTQYVQAVKLKAGESFPGMPAAKDEKTVSFYDMSKAPPELRKFDPAEIESTKTNEAWKHPPPEGYTNEQLADVVAYLRFVFAGDKKPVAPSDVE